VIPEPSSESGNESVENPGRMESPERVGNAKQVENVESMENPGREESGLPTAERAGPDFANATPSAVAVVPEPLPFSFTGQATPYFRIWIVNFLLSVVTLGLWSPWAKVRKRRYFYGHTWVGGANFEYHGNPVAILRGRLIAAAAFVVYWFVDHLLPGAGPALLLVLLTAAPWIVARSLAFNAANSSHRGIRFGFDGSARAVLAAIWPLFLWPVVLWLSERDPLAIVENATAFIVTTAGLYLVLLCVYPYAVARVRRLTVSHSSWGQTRFLSSMRTKKVYAIYGIAIVLGVAGLVAMAVVGVAGYFVARLVPDIDADTIGIATAVWAGLLYVILVIVVMAYTRSRVGNLVFDTAELADLARFKSRVSARRLARLYAQNLFAIMFSAGLLIPWAAIRVARYRVESLSVQPQAALDSVSSAVTAGASATGEELGEVFGFDLAL